MASPVHDKCFEGENFCSCEQNTIHGKIVAVHQAKAIMYILYTANDLQLAKKPQKFSPFETFAMYVRYLRIALYKMVNSCYTRGKINPFKFASDHF